MLGTCRLRRKIGCPRNLEFSSGLHVCRTPIRHLSCRRGLRSTFRVERRSDLCSFCDRRSALTYRSVPKETVPNTLENPSYVQICQRIVGYCSPLLLEQVMQLPILRCVPATSCTWNILSNLSSGCRHADVTMRYSVATSTFPVTR